MYIFGQIFGVFAAIMSFLRPQFSRKKHIISCTLLGNVFCTLNFILIGTTGAAPLMCIIAIFQSILALWHDRRNTDVSTGEKIIFLAMYLGFGLFGFAYSQNYAIDMSWATAVELMPTVGALMLMFSNFAKKEQLIRIFLLFNAATWMVYSLIIGSTTFLSNTFSLCSTAFAIWKYREK